MYLAVSIAIYCHFVINFQRFYKIHFFPSVVALTFACMQWSGVCLGTATWSSLWQFIIATIAIIMLVKQSYH